MLYPLLWLEQVSGGGRSNRKVAMKFLFQCPCCSCFCFLKPKKGKPKEKEAKGEEKAEKKE